MKYKILKKEWFTGGQSTVGVVAIETYGGWKAYIGVAKGDDEEADAQNIAAHGAKLPRSIALAIFDTLEPTEWKS